MKSLHRSTRSSPTTLVSTAGALVALVAVAAMMTSSVAATPAAIRGGEARQTITEGAKVRAAVAAVAAAARKLVESNRLVHALPAQWADLVAIVPVASATTCEPQTSASPLDALPERLLDLPPPAC